MADIIERELGWDDEISNDSPEYVTLPAGDYDFEITGFERGRFDGSEKLPPCNKAVVSVKIANDTGVCIVNHQLFMHTKTEGLLCAFFTAIGQRQHGEKLKMNWNAVIGSKGRCKLGVREYISDKSGETIKINEIKKFYEPKPAFTPGAF